PQEGTMLTVLREAAEAAASAAASLPDGGSGRGCVGVLHAAVRAAESAEAHTIEQLEALREAGVPDAGGEGVCVVLRGLLGSLTRTLPAVRTPEIDRPIAQLGDHSEEAFGFCTEFLLEAAGGSLNLDAVRELAEAGVNRSVVVVGDEELARVHAHTLEPEKLIDEAAKLGAISRVKVEDMSAQHVRFRSSGS